MLHKYISFALTLFAMPAAAVCLNGFPSVEDEYRHSSAVVIGQVVAEQPEPEVPLHYLEGNDVHRACR